jgi:arylsulfatase A-like enzyme
VWTLLLACAPSALDLPAAEVPARPAPAPSGAIPLAGGPLAVRYTLPPTARPGGAPAPDVLTLQGPFTFVEDKKKAAVWAVPLPVAPDLLPTASRGTHTFGSTPPPGFVVTGPDGEVPFEWRGKKRGTWGFDPRRLFVGAAFGDDPPVASDFTVTFPKATAAERSMNLDTAELGAEAFAVRTFTVDGGSHRGWFLPAPGRAEVDLVVPEAGVLGFAPGLVPAALNTGARSDGATVVVTLTADGVATELSRTLVTDARFEPVRVDLRRWAGRAVTLAVATEPGGDNVLDYVLLEDPVVYPSRAHPRKVVMAFVDTLRPDHLGFMGYTARATSPHLDRWAAHAAVFSQARSVAPWTLPSAKAALTGSQPEDWGARDTIAERFAAGGFRTDALVSNAFLSQPFGLERGWASFRYEHLARPDDLVAMAISRLRQWPDRDQLVLVHFMGPHLPWEEPWHYRWRWAGSRPASLEAATRGQLMEVAGDDPASADVREWATARYDQNVRWTDDELASLLEAAGADATVVLFSDHGEELWDHGSFEHGHQFGDELLRVPLAIKSPGLKPGRYDAPVSLLDVTPTLLELAGLPPDPDAAGRSLAGLTFGDDDAEAALTARPHAFGRPLYGPDGWGVVTGDHKWTSRDGHQTLYDLRADPLEQVDVAGPADLRPYPTALGAGLDREVHAVWRVSLTGEPWSFPLTLTVSHPDGVAAAWTAYDPRGRTSSMRPEVEASRATLSIPAEAELPTAIYVLPAGDATRPSGLGVTLLGREVQAAARVPDGVSVAPAARSKVFLSGRDARYAFTVDLVLVPEPSGTEVAGFHADVEQQLRDLGYLGDGE